jgi:hypothetical protein
MSDQKSNDKPKAAVCTNYSPVGYKGGKAGTRQDREMNELTV